MKKPLLTFFIIQLLISNGLSFGMLTREEQIRQAQLAAAYRNSINFMASLQSNNTLNLTQKINAYLAFINNDGMGQDAQLAFKTLQNFSKQVKPKAPLTILYNIKVLLRNCFIDNADARDTVNAINGTLIGFYNLYTMGGYDMYL